MRIFKIKTDTNNVQLVQPVDHSKITLEKFNFDCEPKMQNWEDDLCYIYNPKVKSKSFFHIDSSCLIFDEKTLELCRTVFEMSGEIIPIKIERSDDLYILNVLECMNGLDYEKTKWDYYSDGTKGRILYYVFHKERVMNESTIFKIPETSKKDIFCFADVKDREDEFYHIYHDNNLSGLIFEEIINEIPRERVNSR
jgi:hypothetical protein